MADGYSFLAPYLPARALEIAGKWLQVPGLVIRISNRNGQRLGSYQSDRYGNQKISLNRNQDPYSFLITLVHEIAHMQVRMATGLRTQPHGKEWKQVFSRLIKEASLLPSLPSDVREAMQLIARVPGSRHFSNEQVSKVLLRYSIRQDSHELLCDLPHGTKFSLPDGRVYVKGERRRTRFRCRRDGTTATYLVGGAVPVSRVA